MKLCGFMFFLGIVTGMVGQSYSAGDGTGGDTDVDRRLKYRHNGLRGRTESWRGKKEKTSLNPNSESPVAAAFYSYQTFVDPPPPAPTPSSSNSSVSSMQMPIQIAGIFPNYSVLAESGPKRSECGIGALMAWADNLYLVSYLSVPNAGSGTGLYVIEGKNYQVSVICVIGYYHFNMHGHRHHTCLS